MATAWNLKRVHQTLNVNIKEDVNKIYQDLANINSSIDRLMEIDQKASAKNGENISNFSGHKAYKYFNVLKKNGGYYTNSENFYKAVYKLCQTLCNRGQERAVKDNNSKYKSYSKWSATLPGHREYKFQHAIISSVNEEVTNVCSNIYSLKDAVDRSYDSYIRDTRTLARDLKTLKKYTPDGLDRKITKIISKIESRITATEKRKRELSEYINEVVLKYLIENSNDESSVTATSEDAGFNDTGSQTIDV